MCGEAGCDGEHSVGGGDLNDGIKCRILRDRTYRKVFALGNNPRLLGSSEGRVCLG